MKDIILYHGSRGGIEGKIRPISRERCDFGKGFYMGQSPEQAKGLVVDDPEPYFYTLNLKLSEIPERRILKLQDDDWLYTVLACRKKVRDFSELSIARDALTRLKDYDLVVGPIADDQMNEAMRAFTNGALTDEGLKCCLQRVRYGDQFVALTDFACSKIEIISEQEMLGREIDDIREYNKRKLDESKNTVNLAIQQYRRNGYFLDEIIDRETRTKGRLK